MSPQGEQQIQLEINPLLSETCVVYVFGQLNARQNARHFPTPEALLSCLKRQFGVEAHTAEHAVTDLRKRGKAQILRPNARVKRFRPPPPAQRLTLPV